MRVLTIAVVAALVAATTVLGASSSNVNVKQMFEDFKIKYGKKYASAQEEANRFAVFAANMRKAAQLEAANPLAKFGANEFADLSATEFKSHHNGNAHFARAVRQSKKANKAASVSAQMKAAAAGQAVDWRKKGA